MADALFADLYRPRSRTVVTELPFNADDYVRDELALEEPPVNKDEGNEPGSEATQTKSRNSHSAEVQA